MLKTASPPPLSLYIHLPWCVQKCPYCDFNSHTLRAQTPYSGYTDALLRDLETEATRAQGRPLESVFFGGGTPSLFPAEEIDRILSAVRARLNMTDDCEITLEANPGTLEQGRFEGYRAAGVNRLSLGIQSFAPEQLKRLGRIHGREEALRAVDAARNAGFDNFNLDLMFGLPEQSLDAAGEDLRQAIALAPTHISYYQLTLEPNTPFHARPPVLPDDERIYAMQEAGQELLAEYDYEQYETSAYATTGRRCRHNLNYWSFGDYLAIGAGAHGKFSGEAGIHRYWKLKYPRAYTEKAGSAEVLGDEHALTVKDVVLEYMMNALRLSEGFSIRECTARTGLPWSAFEPTIEQARVRGLLECEHGRVWPTPRGRLYLNDLLELFVP